MARRLHSLNPASLVYAGVVALQLVACADGACPEGCPDDQVCDADVGACVATSVDCLQLGCPDPGQECDPHTKSCVPVRDCVSEGCPDGQVCNSRTNACEQRQGCRVDGCPPPLECDLITGECRPSGCRKDGDCKPGRICDGPSAQCVAGCRGEGRCPAGAVCSLSLDPDAAAEGAVGACVPGCRADDDCPFGQACPDGTGGSDGAGDPDAQCEDEPACDLNEQCRSDEVCEGQRCVRGPCTEGIPCPDRAYCDPETGRCLAADCADDLFEDNDDPDSARRLLPQAYAHLQVCPGDEDWYLVQAEDGARVEVTVRFDAQAGDLDLEVFDADLYLLASSRGRGNPEQIVVVVGADRTALLRVQGVQGAQAQYFLEISVSQPEACEDDSREENDDFRTPAPLPSGRYDELISCPADEDWFSVSLEAGDGLEVALTSPESPPPTLERLGPKGERDSAPQELSGRRLRLQRADEAGRHLLRVRTDADRPVPYRLDLRTYPGGLPCQDDDLEDNDTPEAAAAVVGRTYARLMSCPDDADWFAVAVERVGGVVAATVTPLDALPAPTLTLFGPDGAASPAGEDPLAAATGPATRTGEALIRVLPTDSGVPARYDLTVEVREGPAPCADDSLEPEGGNDAAARATLLRPGPATGLVLCPHSPEDWYAVDVATDGAVRLRVVGEGVACGLRTTDGSRLLQACVAQDGGPTSAAAVGLERGRYRMQVHGDPPAEGLEYRLELEVLP